MPSPFRSLGRIALCLLTSLIPVFAQQAKADEAEKPEAVRLELATSRLAQARTAENELAVAEAQRDLFELDAALEHFAAAVRLDATAASYRAQIDYLLALGDFDGAGSALDEALARFAKDGVLLEQRAALAAARGQHQEAVRYLELSWDAGRPPLAWLERGRIEENLHSEPYRSLLDADILLSNLDGLTLPALEKRLDLLAEAIDAETAPRLTRFLAGQTSAEVLRLGLRALRRLENPAPHLRALLGAEPAQVRRAALLDIWSADDAAAYRQDVAALLADRDPGNADLAEVLVALSDAAELDGAKDSAVAEKVLRGVSGRNAYRHLALQNLENLLERDGHLARAAEVAAEITSFEPGLSAERGKQATLDNYWECVDRKDLRENRNLLYHHQFIERIDARVYGLPKNDFDDQKNLTIPERLFLRSYYRRLGNPLPTEGPIQYPREIRHFLRKLASEEGKAADCAGRLAALPLEPVTRSLGGNSETKVEEDSNIDNEVNISVNPYDPRYVIVTSNDYDGATGNDMNRSSNWGKTWTGGDVAITGNCCDPVTQYTRTSVSGTMTNVAYHSTLVSASGGGYGSRLLYSTNNGSSWTDCGYTIGSNRDRQDHAIDSNPSSACYNKIYLGHHSGTQYVATSTGTTFPYCQSFSETSTGVGSTIGSAIVISTNGRAHNFFTQYGSPGGVYQVSTSNCGSTWGSATKLAGINNVGTFEWPIPSTCSRQVYRYPQAGTDTQTSSAYLNNIYVVWNDLSGNCTAPGCSGNTTCNNDIFLLIGTPNSRSNPTSWTWSSRNLTDAMSDDYTDEFYPSLSVDPADGAVYISYYRTNSGASSITPRKTQVHYVVTKSIDGGATFSTPYQITSQPTDESGSGANSAMQWGDYTWNDVISGVTYAAWTDRREGADEDVWASKICSEPTHWSERAPSFTAPATTATNTGGLTYTVSWSLPDLYWGDADENNAARKFQLWVDGSLAQDNISASATSTAYTAPNTASHTLYVRAVNQCGIGKSYAAATIGSGGGNTAPSVTITAPTTGSSYNAGASVSFSGTATDTQDGTLSGSLAWTSSIDGSIGSGASFSTSSLSVGTHTITAAVTDSGGLSGNASINVTINSVSGNVLTNGVPVTGISGATGSTTFYTLAVPAGATNLTFTTSGGTGDADLYVRFGSDPTTSTYDCRSWNSSNSESCSFPSPQTGTYHVLINGYAAYSGLTLTGSYTAGGSNTAPSVSITAPSNGATYTAGASVSFSGTATDAQDGTLTSSLAWTSSIGGSIGSGGSFSTPSLAVGTHTITASVTDSGGLSGSASISVTINAASNVLTNGVPVTGLSGSTGSNTYYTLVVPSGASNLTFTTAGSSGDADLYVRLGSNPTTSTYDCSSTSASANESCSFASPTAGTYYVLVYAYSTYSGLSLTGSYTTGGGSPVTVTFYSVGSEDARIWESSETSNVGGGGNSTDNTTASLRIGDFSDDTQYRSVVSFDTSSIPDTATITAATLRLKRGTSSGTNPFTTHGTCTVDMSNAFGGSTAFAASDFEAAAAASGVASMSNVTANGSFSTGTLDATGRAAVNKTGKTQFRVYFTLDDNDDLGSDYIGFYSGEAASGNKPELVITYTP